MKQPLKLLMVEDSEDDSQLLLRELVKSGFATDIQRVDNKAALMNALQDRSWDIAITDHNLPGFSSSEAIECIKRSGLDIPVIIVSASISEQDAVAGMRSGASDYIMKDNMARLVPAIEREMREAQIRKQHRQSEDIIRQLADFDVLTGLINRSRFEELLLSAMGKVRENNIEYALLYIDLDQFKVVNDTCGHVAGDALLKQLANVLSKEVRSNDALGRLGGDEFGLLIENCPAESARHAAEKLLRSIYAFRFNWFGRNVSVSASIGVAQLNANIKNIDDLMRNVDIACYAAKEQGRNRMHAYTESDVELQRRRGEMDWVGRIQRALEQDRFMLYHQNVKALGNGNGSEPHCEILIRMIDEDGGIIAPGMFLPAAERYNLAPAIDRWVVRKLLKMLSDDPGLLADQHQRFFVNLSGSTLSDARFYSFLQQELERSKIPPNVLCFEITETAAITNLDAAIRFMASIRAQGCKFALDDFGAGLSSFSYLKSIPVDYLKIDGSFVRNIVSDSLDRSIVESVNRVAHVVGLETVAEFVENDAILKLLQDMGVDYAQGYGVHIPEPFGNNTAKVSSATNGKKRAGMS